jgi:RNA polymerase sigma-70 factor, ECF subfamily
LQSVPDEGVVARLADDPGALEELFRRHRRSVLMYAARRCERPADVDDVVAETFLAALEFADRYDPSKGEVRAWLLGIAHNQVGLIRRGERRQRGIELAAGRECELSEDAFGRLVEQMAAAQESAAIQRALERLTHDEREALLLVGRDDLSQKEAAAVLGISATAFRVRLLRARRAMRALLPPAVPEYSPAWALPKEVEK